MIEMMMELELMEVAVHMHLLLDAQAVCCPCCPCWAGEVEVSTSSSRHHSRIRRMYESRSARPSPN